MVWWISTNEKGVRTGLLQQIQPSLHHLLHHLRRHLSAAAKGVKVMVRRRLLVGKLKRQWTCVSNAGYCLEICYHNLKTFPKAFSFGQNQSRSTDPKTIDELHKSVDTIQCLQTLPLLAQAESASRKPGSRRRATLIVFDQCPSSLSLSAPLSLCLSVCLYLSLSEFLRCPFH